VIALLAAAARPRAVRSLVVSEPGLLRIAAGNPDVDAMLENGDRLYDATGAIRPSEFLRMFRAGVHSAHHTPDQLPDWLERGAELASRERRPWEADVPLGDLAAAPFPKLVISGGHSPAFDTVCDVLAERLGAERRILTGRGHTIPSLGPAYNTCVHEFLARAEAYP
jgi:pimeloyl-ACP methyl ester carboxylesterase